eukprot:COSAG01_NODE_10787_length_2080_cov_7.455830_2_plen_69_part_00
MPGTGPNRLWVIGGARPCLAATLLPVSLAAHDKREAAWDYAIRMTSLTINLFYSHSISTWSSLERDRI